MADVFAFPGKDAKSREASESRPEPISLLNGTMVNGPAVQKMIEQASPALRSHQLFGKEAGFTLVHNNGGAALSKVTGTMVGITQRGTYTGLLLAVPIHQEPIPGIEALEPLYAVLTIPESICLNTTPTAVDDEEPL